MKNTNCLSLSIDFASYAPLSTPSKYHHRGSDGGILIRELTGNLYGATAGGVIFVYPTRTVITSGCTKFISGHGDVEGLAIEFPALTALLGILRYGANMAQSSDMEGQDVKNDVRLPSGSHPRGVGVLGGGLYWTTLF